ncbi:amino acid adenylation domain-containing protein [Phytohabitans sp. LJ34]|uniref:amino acid adenylation domain-containing protein n=1 Tax=Phytohabitans sp. LJ34 TaxID=3452217 RepID=UPI003F88BA43
MTPPDPLTRFARTVREAPAWPAVRCGGTVLSFAELDERTARLAAMLRAQGIGPGDRVGVSLPRGVDLVVAPLAVWRAGAAYVPLDPGYPAERLAFMAADAGIATRVTSIAPAGGPRPSISDWAAPELPAYVVYTSGSTGRPKGVEVTRGHVAALMAALEQAGVYPACRRVVGWNASMSFDASVKQWIRVCRGDTVVVLEDADRTDPDRLRALVETAGIQDLDMTPTHWQIAGEELGRPLPAGRVLRLLLGGEPVPERIWQEIAEAPWLDGLNLYGPTECTVDATVAPIAGPVPHLGTPLPDSTVYVLDGKLCPADDGEVYIGGPRVALGYVNRPGLTARRFLPDPFTGGRMYRTGDRARRTAEGLLTFAGRADRQVKWRGYRVELGEIEHHLRTHPEVAAAAVVLRGERLVAYVVPAGAEPPRGDRLVRHLLGSLPEFMLPSTFVALDALPVTPNGKVDLATLAG